MTITETNVDRQTPGDPAARAVQTLRKHPGSTPLVARAPGIAVVLLSRDLAPAPSWNQARRLLEDIQNRLSHLGTNGMHALSWRMGSLGNAHLDRSSTKPSRAFKDLFQ